MKIFYYLGIANLLFISIVSILLAHKHKNFTIKKHTISCLGTHKKRGKYFNVALAIFSLNQVVFSLILTSVVLQRNSFVSFLFLAGGILLLVSAIFPRNNYPKLHPISALVSAVTVSLGIFFLVARIIQTDLLMGVLLGIATLLVLTSFLLRRVLRGEYWELILALGVALWNILFTFYLFGT